MIVFDLLCSRQHRFEGWFRSSEDFAGQQQGGLLDCPQCGCAAVVKAPMAPAVSAKMNRATAVEAGTRDNSVPAIRRPKRPEPPAISAEIAAAFVELAAAQAKALSTSKWVGNDFAERSRAIHYGEAAVEPIHGRASADEAAALIEEGIAVAPLLVPIVPPDEAN